MAAGDKDLEGRGEGLIEFLLERLNDPALTAAFGNTTITPPAGEVVIPTVENGGVIESTSEDGEAMVRVTYSDGRILSGAASTFNADTGEFVVGARAATGTEVEVEQKGSAAPVKGPGY